MVSIEELKTKIIPIAALHGVAEIYLFGSYARGEATSESDIDLVIRPGAIRTFMQLGRFLTDLEAQFPVKLDVLTVDQMESEPLLKKNILKDRILIYRK